jgi:hypothetical protein
MEIFDPKQYILADSQEYSTKIDNTFDRPDLLIERRAFFAQNEVFFCETLPNNLEIQRFNVNLQQFLIY